MTQIVFDNTYARLPAAFFSQQVPTPVPSPSLIALNMELAESLGLDGQWLESSEGLAVLSGNSVPEGAEPLLIEASMAFGTGHHGTTQGCLMALDVGFDATQSDLWCALVAGATLVIEDGLERPDRSKMLGVRCRRCGFEDPEMYRAYLDEA